jgi:AmmeMemoRadiSam system protein A
MAGLTLGDLLWQPDTIWIISSDFTHYGHHFGYTPFTRDVPERLEQLDKGAVDYIEKLDMNGFLDYVERTGATICGAIPIAVLIAAVTSRPSQYTCRLITYTTSGKLTRDYAHSVSYASLAVTDPQDRPATAAPPARNSTLTADDRHTLLGLARDAIRSRLEDEAVPLPEEKTLPDTLRRNGAAFVTLHLEGALRGCIGNLEAREPLYQNVAHNARNAAFGDPRFAPLTREEFDRVHIEISVLTPARPIASLDEFTIGRHGIILEKGPHRAVFLPQVAPEQGWDKETTLSHLALKAGMNADDWRRGARFSVFEAIVFGET